MSAIPGVAPTIPGVGAGAAPAIPGSPIPLAAGDYLNADLQAKTAYQNALAQINSNRQSALQTYGYTGSIDPNTGTITNMQVDPNNPFGQFQNMLRSHALNQQQVESTNLARGIGAASGPRGGGLAAQGITADKMSFGADSAQLGQNIMSTLEGLQGQQTSAQTTMNDALWQNELQSAQNAILNQMFDQADFSGIQDPGYGDTGSTDPSLPPSSGTGSGSSVKQPINSYQAMIRAGQTPGKFSFLTGQAAPAKSTKNTSPPARKPSKKQPYARA